MKCGWWQREQPGVGNALPGQRFVASTHRAPFVPAWPGHRELRAGTESSEWAPRARGGAGGATESCGAHALPHTTPLFLTGRTSPKLNPLSQSRGWKPQVPPCRAPLLCPRWRRWGSGEPPALTLLAGQRRRLGAEALQVAVAALLVLLQRALLLVAAAAVVALVGFADGGGGDWKRGKAEPGVSTGTVPAPEGPGRAAGVGAGDPRCQPSAPSEEGLCWHVSGDATHSPELRPQPPSHQHRPLAQPPARAGSTGLHLLERRRSGAGCTWLSRDGEPQK